MSADELAELRATLDLTVAALANARQQRDECAADAVAMRETLAKVDEIACRSVSAAGYGDEPPEPANRDGEELAMLARAALAAPSHAAEAVAAIEQRARADERAKCDRESFADVAELGRVLGVLQAAGVKAEWVEGEMLSKVSPSEGVERLEAKVRADERAKFAALVEKRRADVTECIARGKGEWPKAGYVRDETWSNWQERRCTLTGLLDDLRALAPPASVEAPVVLRTYCNCGHDAARHVGGHGGCDRCDCRSVSFPYVAEAPDAKLFDAFTGAESTVLMSATPPAAKATCATCNDTHLMTLGDRDVMCTRCPTPCQKCRGGGNGPYCEKRPCSCECHGVRP